MILRGWLAQFLNVLFDVAISDASFLVFFLVFFNLFLHISDGPSSLSRIVVWTVPAKPPFMYFVVQASCGKVGHAQ